MLKNGAEYIQREVVGGAYPDNYPEANVKTQYGGFIKPEVDYNIDFDNEKGTASINFERPPGNLKAFMSGLEYVARPRPDINISTKDEDIRFSELNGNSISLSEGFFDAYERKKDQIMKYETAEDSIEEAQKKSVQMFDRGAVSQLKRDCNMDPAKQEFKIDTPPIRREL